MVTVYDLDGVSYEKESVDARECINRLGWSLQPKVVEKAEQKISVNNSSKILKPKVSAN